MRVSEPPRPDLDPTIADYYHRAPEEHRLEQGPFLLEEARTRELIERHARRPPATVLDVGGAAGAYAIWLADAGYVVHLVDPVPRLVAEAERRSAAPDHSPPVESVRRDPWTSPLRAQTCSSSSAHSII
jgi:methylase of polypeptide subunit release factors